VEERFRVMSRQGRNAKALCDSGISTPSGNSNFSSLFSVTGCRGVSGHEIGFDFTKSDVVIGHQLQEMLNRMKRKEEGPLYQGSPTYCVGMVTFNQAYMNSPASIVRCTSCNRVDFDDRASNMGLSASYEMPSEAFVQGEQAAIQARDKEAFWDQGAHDSLSKEIFLPKMETAAPVTSRYYVSHSRERGSGEMDTVEIGEAMSKTGSCFGLTYLGADKVDPLTFILREPSDPAKTRTVRYSVAKLLRRKLPNLLESRYNTTEELDIGLNLEDLGDLEDLEDLGDLGDLEKGERSPCWEAVHNTVFSSFERTRKHFDINEQNEGACYLLRRVEEQLFRLNRGLCTYMNQEGAVNEDFRHTPFRLECCTESYFYESIDKSSRREIISYFNTFVDTRRVEHNDETYYRIEAWRYRRGNINLDEDPGDACESFDVFRGSEPHEMDPDEWRGPWYRHSQSMDEDELVFFNLNPLYLIRLHEWLSRKEEGHERHQEQYHSFSVLAAMLLRLYVSNDVMHALSPTRDRMLRLLLQLFVDQMLDLYSFFVSASASALGPASQIVDDSLLLLSRSEREEMGRVDRGEGVQEGPEDRKGPLWWKKRKRAFREGWKKRVQKDPESLVRVYDKLYPHGRRFFSATELPDLAHLFPFTDIWNKYRPMSEAVACLINHIIFCKTQAHRCLIRSIATVLTQHKNESASLISLIMDIIIVHLMGNYTGATHRPCFRSRALLRCQFMEMATRDHEEIIGWIDQNQHMVYICFREFMYDQMARTGALRGLMIQTSWQIENEMYCKYACDMTRVVLSDRVRFLPSSLDDRLITNLDDIYRAKDISSSIAENCSTLGKWGKRWCVQHPYTRDMMIPHLMRGYRKRLHQIKIHEAQADGIILSMCNKDIFALIDVMNEETLTKCREFQTKLGKGHFWECVQKDLGKFISDKCPYVLDLEVTETLNEIDENTQLAMDALNENTQLALDAQEGRGKEVKKEMDKIRNDAERAKKRITKGSDEAKKKVIQSMISEISSYKSDMFSTTESDGILNGNHIRAIKLVAKHAARTTQGNMIDLSWLIVLGVSYGTIAYLNFLFYAYLYHGLPDNRIKMDMPFILDRQHKKIKTVSKDELKKLSKYKQRKYEEEKYRTEGCYDIGVPFEPWMDECAIQWELVGDTPDTSSSGSGESFFHIFSHDSEGRPFRVRPEGEEGEEEGDAAKQRLYERLKESLCHVSRQMGFYDDDDEEYRDEDVPIDVAIRSHRVHQVLGRDPTVGERDIAILCMFFHFYKHATFMQTVGLPREVKEQQIRALKARMGLREIDMPPADLGVMRYCGCGAWTESIVSSPEKVATIYAKGEYGAAFDLVSGIKRCQLAKTRFCGRRLNEIDMIGRAVRMGKSWYVVCVICGIITLWRRESHCDLGPTCGCHACPMRPATKYPMSTIALSSKEDIGLHRSLLNQGQLMNGYIQCVYCRDYIIPGKAVAVQVWTDDDGRADAARPVDRSTTLEPMEKEEEEEDTETTETWEARESVYQDRFDRAYWEDGYCDPLDTGIQRTVKPKRYRRGTVYMCSGHMKHIAWKIRRDKIPTKNNLRRDILRVCEQKMNRRRSARFIKGK